MNSALLIEIGVEELPPMAVQPLADAFARDVVSGLDSAGITRGEAKALATPRRLAVLISETAGASESEAIEKTGPTVAIAFDENGEPTRAGEGFARSMGTTVDRLDVVSDGGSERLVYRGIVEGRPLGELLQGIVDDALRSLPIPKRMRWGESDAAFVRPVHWVVAQHGRDTLPLKVFGVTAGNTTHGHRFHHPEPITLNEATDYVDRLRHPGYVLVDPAERRVRLMSEVESAASSLDGLAMMPEALVTEVLALVEWPVGIAGRFDRRYLRLPREVLIATLEGHQRYFPVENASGALLAGFVTVANLESRDPSQVVAGNERVVHPRLADALFFWNQDIKAGLSTRVDALQQVSFEESLGSMADKSARIRRIAAAVAESAGADAETVDRACVLAKADLLTEMVGEFPELQGLMGGYYAEAEGQSTSVVRALAEQYAPANAGDAIADTPAGRALAVADKLDTLAGIFAINKRPTGDKDPYGLRRAALGVLRTLIEAKVHCDLQDLLSCAIAAQPVDPPSDTRPALWMFHMERLRHYYRDRGIPSPQFESVAALDIRDMYDFDRRIHAVNEFARRDAARIVGAAHKRIRNIVRRNASSKTADDINTALLDEEAEVALHNAWINLKSDVAKASAEGEYGDALACLATLGDPLDAFFEAVMVMTEDKERRANRLALLAAIDELCRRVADLSYLSIEASP